MEGKNRAPLQRKKSGVPPYLISQKKKKMALHFTVSEKWSGVDKFSTLAEWWCPSLVYSLMMSRKFRDDFETWLNPDEKYFEPGPSFLYLPIYKSVEAHYSVLFIYLSSVVID